MRGTSSTSSAERDSLRLGTRLRQALRRPVTHWAVAGLLALATALGAASLTAEARRAIDQHGVTAPTLVATAPIARGEPVGDRMAVRAVPLAHRPDHALEVLNPDAVATVALEAGQILTPALVGQTGGVAAGEAALALPRSPIVPPARAGDPVMLVVTADPFAGMEPSRIAGRVIEITDDQLLVAVPSAQLPDAAAAVAGGTVVVALSS